jgi:mannose-6-phosphate isomerase-like protein (cupin superfamily)
MLLIARAKYPGSMAEMGATQIINVEALRSGAAELREWLWSAEAVKHEGYEVGYIRFTPTDQPSGSLVRHADRDVVCLVLSGTGRLEHGSATTSLRAGDVCQIPVGTPHSFFADGGPLEMLYATIRVGDLPA